MINELFQNDVNDVNDVNINKRNDKRFNNGGYSLFFLMLGSHCDNDIHRFGRQSLVASDSLPKVCHQSILTTFAHSILNSSSSSKRLYISTGDISKVILVKWWSITIEKKKLGKYFFNIILKRLKTKYREI